LPVGGTFFLLFSISEFVKNVGSELNIRGSHRRMSLPEVQDTGNLMNEFQGYDQSHEDFMSTCVRCRKSTDAARSLRFKEDLVALSRRFGRCLRVALYPPYTSKRHPIEHRLFCHVARRLSGVILDSHQTALEAVQRTYTQTGLTVTPRLLDTLYELGRNVLRHSSISTTNSFATTLFLGNETTSSVPIDFRDKM